VVSERNISPWMSCLWCLAGEGGLAPGGLPGFPLLPPPLPPVGIFTGSTRHLPRENGRRTDNFVSKTMIS